MQPYFYPYIGQFELCNRVDLWIAYGQSRYIRHGWINRNRVLHPAQGWQYITVPVAKHPHKTPIADIRIATGIDWQRRILRQLAHYGRDAPHYAPAMGLVREGLAMADGSLMAMNVTLFRQVCRYLGITTPIRVFGELDLALGPVADMQDLPIRICQAVGADEYVNPPGGVDLYDPDRFAAEGIKLTIQPQINMVYDCSPYRYEPALSIVDVMMWNAPAAIKQFLDRCSDGAESVI